MNKYECIYVARQDIPQSQVDNMSEQFTGVVKEYGRYNSQS
jgi:ribosomal protein S6